MLPFWGALCLNQTPHEDAAANVERSASGSRCARRVIVSCRLPPQLTTFNPQPPQIPDHELLRRIGGGSYGEVWLARNALGGYRAVKIVHRQNFDHDRPFEREFAGLQKFEPISRSHEGLVDLLQVGRNDAEGYFYYVMELADDSNAERETRNAELTAGASVSTPHSALRTPHSYAPRTLRSDLQTRGSLPPAECLALGLALTRALGFLHGQGLVHRDIKPSNIIFVGGVPKLADVGLVAGVGDARSYVGTEGFIPPEGPGSPQADLYSLAIVLYMMSTGKSHHDFPEPLPDLAAQPDHARWLEFNAIIHKACVADPRQRYQSAAAMLAELELLHRGESVKQCRVWERRKAWGKKTSMGIMMVAIVVAGFLIGTNEFKRRTTTARRPSVTTFETSGTKNREAYNAYDLGRFFWKKRTAGGLTNAIVQFEKAARLDSQFARAYAGLADCYNLLDGYGGVSPEETRPKARAAVLRALELDPKLAEAHASLAKFKLEQEWDWPGAEREFRKALGLDSNYALAHLWYANYLSAMGRLEEAIRESRRAVELEPASLTFNSNLGVILRFARHYDQAIEQFRKTIKMEPNFASVYNPLASAYEDLGRYEEAVAALEKCSQLWGIEPSKVTARGAAYQSGGMKAYWQKRMEQLKDEFAGKPLPALDMAELCTLLGDSDEAFIWLEQAYGERRHYLKYLAVDPTYDPLRSDPRFHELLQKMKLEH